MKQTFVLHKSSTHSEDFVTDVASHQPDNGFASHPPSGITKPQIYEKCCGKPATQGPLEENEKSSKWPATIKHIKRKNRKRKHKAVVKGTLSRDSWFSRR
jgi:hypothetical protein